MMVCTSSKLQLTNVIGSTLIREALPRKGEDDDSIVPSSVAEDNVMEQKDDTSDASSKFLLSQMIEAT